MLLISLWKFFSLSCLLSVVCVCVCFMKMCWIFSNAFSLAVEMIICFLLKWFITFIDFHILNQPYISEVNHMMSSYF